MIIYPEQTEVEDIENEDQKVEKVGNFEFSQMIKSGNVISQETYDRLLMLHLNK